MNTVMDIDLKQWQYYLALENDFLKTISYVELDTDNGSTYSIEYSKLLLLIGAEFETVTKSLIKIKDPDIKISDIADIKLGILTNFPRICENEIRIPKYKMNFFPLKNWNNNEKLKWWEGFRLIKHSRLSNFKYANLENVLNSLGCLLIVLVYLYRYRDNERHLHGYNLLETDGVADTLISKTTQDIADLREDIN